MNFLMHKKDFRIMSANPEGLKNEDYILITDEEVKKLQANKMYGMLIIADRNKKAQDAEYAELQAKFNAVKESMPELPSSVAVSANGQDMPLEMPNVKSVGDNIDPTEEFYSKQNTEKKEDNFVDFSTMGIRELRKHAEARKIENADTMSKEQLLEALTR